MDEVKSRSSCSKGSDSLLCGCSLAAGRSRPFRRLAVLSAAVLWSLGVLVVVLRRPDSLDVLLRPAATTINVIPACNLSASDAAVLFDERDLAMFRFVFDWLETPTARCDDLRVFGDKLVCFDAPTTLSSSDACLVYSFGLSGDWAFERDMAALGCEVLAFDPFAERRQDAITLGVRFRPEGLLHQSGILGGKQMLTLDAAALSGHQEIPVQYLAVDVSARGEYGLLQQQITDRYRGEFVLHLVEQLWMEVHLPSSVTQLPDILAVDTLERAFQDLGLMGFRLVYSAPDLSESAELYSYPGVDRPVYLVHHVLLVRMGPDIWSRRNRAQLSRLEKRYG
ncbi:uncharacterized protein LOC122371499 [Amphibalanus amphitrite]|uniref:uncharacterized protein LOC122371499 n=1 Tax=Amphibalanus amphitrite TaxID=1232801 RepID=UPI001C92AD8E|nr:uncharacterized protein LOC122371499 [Amphibalanus amphitrite]